MGRVRLTLAYDGTAFSGFQRQADGTQRTVAGDLDARLAEVCGHPVNLVGAGRTDTGVHALGQVAHFEKMGGIPVERLASVLNSMLQPELRVCDVQPCADSFHARFSALSRTYHYYLCREAPSPYAARYAWWTPKLQSDAVARCEQALLPLRGTHDFAAFCVGEAATGAERTLLHARVRECGRQLRIELTATAFLRSMVRVMAQHLVAIGCGEREPESLRQILRREAVFPLQPAPPHGLHLIHVAYPDGYGGKAQDDWLLPPH